LARALESAKAGVWIAIIIIIAILAAYGGYYTGLEEGLRRGSGVGPTLPSSIKIGVIRSDVAHALEVLNGIQLARDLLNNKSYEVSRNVTLSTLYSYVESPDSVRYLVASLINEDVKVMIGALSNSEIKAILQMLHQNDTILLLVSNEVYDDDVYDDPRVIKMLGGPDVEARVMVDLALEVDKEDLRAAVVVANDSYCLRLANAISEGYSSRGGRVVSRVLYELGKTNITEGLINVNSSSPAVIFFVGRRGDAPTILEVACNVSLKAKWILSSASAGDDLLKEHLASCLSGSCFIVRQNVTSMPRFRDFVELYRKVYHSEPNEMAAYGFDALVLATLSIAYAGKYDGLTIRGAMGMLCNLIGGVTEPRFLDLKGNVIREYAILRLIGAYGDYKFEEVGRWVPISVEEALIEWWRMD